MDKSKFTTKPYIQKVEKPWGHELVFAPVGSPVTGKILYIKEGKRFSLQYHDQKQEILTLLSGQALLTIENEKGEVEELEMETKKGYFVNFFQKHRIKGITDCQILEASSGEKGNTVRTEDDYSRPTETEDLREER